VVFSGVLAGMWIVDCGFFWGLGLGCGTKTRSEVSAGMWIVDCGFFWGLGWDVDCGLWFFGEVFGWWVLGMWFVDCGFLGKSLAGGSLECGLWIVVFCGSLRLCIQGMWFVDCGFLGKSSAVGPGWFERLLEKKHNPQTTFQGPTSQRLPKKNTIHKPHSLDTQLKTSQKKHIPQSTFQGSTSQRLPKQKHNPQTTFPGHTVEDFPKKPHSTIHIPTKTPYNPYKSTIHNVYSSQDHQKKTQTKTHKVG